MTDENDTLLNTALKVVGASLLAWLVWRIADRTIGKMLDGPRPGGGS